MKNCTIVFITLALFMITGNTVFGQRITVTMAGTGVTGYNGDGGSGRQATINAPYDVCVDAADDIYFSDPGNGRIRKISAATGVISTVAGGGTSTADGVPAITESLIPRNLCIDAAGNLFVVASSNQIKRIDAVTNIITTVAGTGSTGYTGDGGLAVGATFNGIYGICVGNTGNIYLVDQGNNRVREITAGTGIINTIAGTGAVGYSGDGGPAIAAVLSSPVTICVSPTGDVFFTDQGGGTYLSRIRKIDAVSGYITTIAGNTSAFPVLDMPALSTWLGEVTGLCMDHKGDLYCNEISCSCRKMDMVTDSIHAVGGNFGIESFSDKVDANLSWMNNPYGICTDMADHVYAADNFNNRIRKMIQLTHTPSFAYGKGQTFYTCPGVAVPLDSFLAITDLDNGQTETWTVVTAPAHGTLSGFPGTAASLGTSGITSPSGMSYSTSFMGLDSFQVQVSDGALSEIVTIYVSTPDAGSISAADNICLGSAVPVYDGVSGGTWSSSDPTIAAITSSGIVTGVASGTATLIYSVLTPCGMTMTALKVINIEALPAPGAMAITGLSALNIGTAITMADPIAGGAWSVSNANATVSATGLVTGVSAGTDNVIYTITNTCGTATATHPVVINNYEPESVPATASAAVISVFPNPASSTLNIQWTNMKPGNAAISIADVTGRVVVRNELINNGGGNGSMSINVADLAEGAYLLSISSDSIHFNDKIVVSK